MGNTPRSNKMELSVETSVGHRLSDIAVGLNVTKNIGNKADVLHLASHSLTLGGQITGEVRSVQVLFTY